jgi:hypothetical protein
LTVEDQERVRGRLRIAGRPRKRARLAHARSIDKIAETPAERRRAGLNIQEMSESARLASQITYSVSEGRQGALNRTATQMRIFGRRSVAIGGWRASHDADRRSREGALLQIAILDAEEMTRCDRRTMPARPESSPMLTVPGLRGEARPHQPQVSDDPPEQPEHLGPWLNTSIRPKSVRTCSANWPGSGAVGAYRVTNRSDGGESNALRPGAAPTPTELLSEDSDLSDAKRRQLVRRLHGSGR